MRLWHSIIVRDETYEAMAQYMILRDENYEGMAQYDCEGWKV